MNPNSVPKYGKVELLLKSPDEKNSSVTKLEFDDCGLMITGDHIIVVIDEKDEIKSTQTSTGKIFNLNQISAYKTHKL